LKCQFKSSDGHRETRGRTEVLILPPLLSFEQAMIGELERIAGQCDGVRYEFGVISKSPRNDIAGCGETRR
jgi:hypothetical protein